MRTPHLVPAVDDLILARDCAVAGLSPAQLARESGHKANRVRRGVYSFDVPADAAERYRMRIRAAMAVRGDPIAAGMSAAALLGLPLVGQWPAQVQVLSGCSSGRRRSGVTELARWGREEVIIAEGFALTSPADTIVEVARTMPFITALVMVDAAIAVDRFGRRAPLATMDEIWEAWERRMPFRGAARAARVLEFGRVGAESTLETVSRTTVFELGFPEPELQYRVPIDDGEREAFFDMAWPAFAVAGEADGMAKYFAPQFDTGTTAEERLVREKRRDAAVRRVGWNPVHWMWQDAWARDGMCTALLEAGLPLQRRPVRLR